MSSPDPSIQNSSQVLMNHFQCKVTHFTVHPKPVTTTLKSTRAPIRVQKENIPEVGLKQ